MRTPLSVGLVVAAAAVWTFAGPAASSGAWSLEQVSGGTSAVGTGEGEHLPGGVGVVPGATEPAPVNKQVEEEFWADPPWQRAREQTEREAAERGAAQRAALESETAQHAAAERDAAEAGTTRCVVPALEGRSLAAARRSLHAAHCTLGKVSRSRGRRGALVVKSQSPGHDRVLASEAAVDIRLGLAPGRHD